MSYDLQFCQVITNKNNPSACTIISPYSASGFILQFFIHLASHLLNT